MTSAPTDPPRGGAGPNGGAGRRTTDRPPPPGPLAVEAALLADALRGLAGTGSGGRLWETVADSASGVAGGGAEAGAYSSADADAPAGAADMGAADTDGGPDCVGHGRPCTSCPLCRLLAMFAGDRPEVVRHLLTAAESLTAAFRLALDAYSGNAVHSGNAYPGDAHRNETHARNETDPPPDPASPGAGHTTHQGPRPGAAAGTRSATAPRPRVQRIDVT